MKCVNCEESIVENAVFCNYCGAKQPACLDDRIVIEPLNEGPASPQESAQAKISKKRKNKSKIATIACFLIGALFLYGAYGTFIGFYNELYTLIADVADIKMSMDYLMNFFPTIQQATQLIMQNFNIQDTETFTNSPVFYALGEGGIGCAFIGAGIRGL